MGGGGGGGWGRGAGGGGHASHSDHRPPPSRVYHYSDCFVTSLYCSYPDRFNLRTIKVHLFALFKVLMAIFMFKTLKIVERFSSFYFTSGILTYTCLLESKEKKVSRAFEYRYFGVGGRR